MSAEELGHRPDTNLQKHVGDTSAASLDIVSGAEKMNLTNELVLALKRIEEIRLFTPPICVTTDTGDNWASVISHQLLLIQNDKHFCKPQKTQ